MTDIKRIKLTKDKSTKEVKEDFVQILLNEGWAIEKDSKEAKAGK